MNCSLSRITSALLVLIAVAATGAQGGIVINQGEISLLLSPGENATRTIHVTNSGDKPQAVSVFASDWQQNEDGAVDAIEPGSIARSATRWLGVHPAKFVLPPGGKQEVTVSAAIPSDAKLGSGDYYSMIFSETEDEVAATDPGTGRDVKLRVIGRLGTKVFIRPAGAQISLNAELTGMRVIQRNDQRMVEIALSNTGDGYFRSEKSFINIQDAKGQKLKTEPIPVFSCLPGHKRVVRVPLPLESGTKYTLLAVIDYGSPEVLAGELEVVAP